MDTRKAKGLTDKARKTIPKEISSMKKRLEAMETALEKGADDFIRWVRKEMPAVKAGFTKFGKTVTDTAAAIQKELKDDVAGVKKRLAAKKETTPKRKPAARKRVAKKPAAKKPAAKKPAAKKPAAKKPAARKAAKKPATRKAAARKTTARKEAPVRRKAAAKKAPARRTTARKKPAPRKKAVGTRS